MDDDRKNAGLPDGAPTPLGADRGAPLFTSTELFGGATEIAIAHANEIYRLRITRQGKLILNK